MMVSEFSREVTINLPSGLSSRLMGCNPYQAHDSTPLQSVSSTAIVKHFFVRYSDQGEVRAFFTPAKVAFLRDHAAHYRVESSPDWLFIYRPGVKVETAHLQEFVDVTSAIASAMLSVQATPFPATA